MAINKQKLKLINIIDNFNYVLSNMIKFLATYYNDINIFMIKNICDSILQNDPSLPISAFLMNIYKNDSYRKNLLKGNDNFFLEEYDKLLSISLSSSYNIDNELVKRLFNFKNIWLDSDQDTKEYIKKSMKILTLLCHEYLSSQ